MNKTIIIYLDDKDNEVPKEIATKMNIVEYDENGNRVKETYMVKAKGNTNEKVTSPLDDIEIDSDNELLKNAVYYDQKSRIEELLDEQKTK